MFTDKFDKKCDQEIVTKRPLFEELHDTTPYDHSPFDHVASALELEVEFPVLHALQASLKPQASHSVKKFKLLLDVYLTRNVIRAMQFSGQMHITPK